MRATGCYLAWSLGVSPSACPFANPLPFPKWLFLPVGVWSPLLPLLLLNISKHFALVYFTVSRYITQGSGSTWLLTFARKNEEIRLRGPAANGLSTATRELSNSLDLLTAFLFALSLSLSSFQPQWENVSFYQLTQEPRLWSQANLGSKFSFWHIWLQDLRQHAPYLCALAFLHLETVENTDLSGAWQPILSSCRVAAHDGYVGRVWLSWTVCPSWGSTLLGVSWLHFQKTLPCWSFWEEGGMGSS